MAGWVAGSWSGGGARKGLKMFRILSSRWENGKSERRGQKIIQKKLDGEMVRLEKLANGLVAAGFVTSKEPSGKKNLRVVESGSTEESQTF